MILSFPPFFLTSSQSDWNTSSSNFLTKEGSGCQFSEFFVGILLQQVMDGLAEDRILYCLQIKTALLLPSQSESLLLFSCLPVLARTSKLNVN